MHIRCFDAYLIGVKNLEIIFPSYNLWDELNAIGIVLVTLM